MHMKKKNFQTGDSTRTNQKITNINLLEKEMTAYDFTLDENFLLEEKKDSKFSSLGDSMKINVGNH